VFILKKVRQPNLIEALIPMLVLIITAILDLLYWQSFFIPLIVAIIAAAVVGYFMGYRWNALEKFMASGMKDSINVVMILFIIGTIVGTWMLSGTIPSLVYYGLAAISPKVFIPTVALATGILAIVIGSSLTSIATVGVAFMAIGEGMGFPPALVAGAVISGAFFGDKLSPLSDTTIMTPALTDTDLFSHVRHMMWDTVPAFVLALALYWIVGLQYTVDVATQTNISTFMSALNESFNINLVLLILPLVTVYIMIKRYPAIPSLVLLSLLGGVFAMIFQGSSVTDVVNVITNGFKSQTGVETIDGLLSRGGISAMYWTVTLIIIASILGGILEGTGMFKEIIDRLIQKARTTGSLILTTVISTLAVAFASGSQVLPLVLSGKGFKETFKDRGLDTKNLSRSVEAAGTVGIALVPWGIVAAFASSMLGGISPYSFIPFIFFAFIVPIINVIYGFTGYTIVKKDYPETINQDNKADSEEGISV
jgi:NhaC family Na+:H+ antiporter